MQAKRIVIVPSHLNEITKNLKRLQIMQHLSSMPSGSPVLLGDYVVTFQPMGSRIVSGVLEIEPNVEARLALISKKTTIEVKKVDEILQKDKEGLLKQAYEADESSLMQRDKAMLALELSILHDRLTGSYARLLKTACNEQLRPRDRLAAGAGACKVGI